MLLGSPAFANVHRADLHGIQLGGTADLAQRKLTLANFADANLEGASLVSIDGRISTSIGTDLLGIDLTGADVSESSFADANLTGTTMCDTILADGSVGNPQLTGR